MSAVVRSDLREARARAVVFMPLGRGPHGGRFRRAGHGPVTDSRAAGASRGDPAFTLARDGGIGSVPHAGEAAGVSSIRGALIALGADRIRHGIRAVDDPGLVRELADRGIVLDVCPVSNLRTGVVASLAAHPLPDLVAAGVPCSVSTDDPAMFGTDLDVEYQAAARLGVMPEAIYQAGLQGALCDEETRSALRRAGEACDWPDAATAAQDQAG